jgi:homoserine kinase
MVTVNVPATSANLGPGFDVLGLALDMYNTVEMAPDPSGATVVEVTGEGAGILKKTGSRLIIDAAHKVFKTAQVKQTGLYIRQYNRIPLFRGMGSSAAAIVGGMAAANALLPEPLAPETILQLAADMEGHPDNVAPALFGGFVAACRTNGFYRSVCIQAPETLRLAVAVPGFALPTKRSREALPKQVPLEDAVFNIGQVALLIASLCQGEPEGLAHAMGDRLHQPYRRALIPGLDEVFDAARNAGALATVLSGAGPAVLSFVLANEDVVGEAMRQAFESCGVKCRIILTKVSNKGALNIDRHR